MIKIYGFWRSSAAYRVRIALNLKGIKAEQIAVSLPKGEQKEAEYRAINPQGLVPFLVDGEVRLSQSLAILRYLDHRFPEPRLFPADPVFGARVEAAALTIACDIHPLNNLKILKYLKEPLGHSQEEIDTWYRHWVEDGFRGLEAMADSRGPYLFGEQLTAADVCLVPQMYNARRFDTDLSAFPRIVAADEALRALPEISAAAPEQQPDAA